MWVWGTPLALTVNGCCQAKRDNRPLLRDINSYAQAGDEGTFGCLAVATEFWELLRNGFETIDLDLPKRTYLEMVI